MTPTQSPLVRRRFVQFTSIGRGLCVFAFCLLVVDVVCAQGKVGRRTKLKSGEQESVASAALQPTITMGSLQLTQSAGEAWKAEPINSLIGDLPKGKSLYVIGNFSGTTDQLRSELNKLADSAQIVEQTANAVVVFTDQATAATITRNQAQEWIDVVEPLTAKPQVDAHAADISGSSSRRRRIGRSRRSGAVIRTS